MIGLLTALSCTHKIAVIIVIKEGGKKLLAMMGMW
jgi:hypothetical protein